ncbi:MAG: phosphoenolpyruvate carboxykinase (ATP), partial [Planctomycetia bacterium]
MPTIHDDLKALGIDRPTVEYNTPPARLYEDAVRFDAAAITSSGALAVHSGARTGRSPKDKRFVEREPSRGEIDWGEVNIPLPPASFAELRRQAIRALGEAEHLYVVDGFAGWDPRYRLKVRAIASRPYHALFMHNMLIRPEAAELSSFDDGVDLLILNAGTHPADDAVPGVTSKTSVALDLEAGESIIFGTEYAGEMKKGVFSVL